VRRFSTNIPSLTGRGFALPRFASSSLPTARHPERSEGSPTQPPLYGRSGGRFFRCVRSRLAHFSRNDGRGAALRAARSAAAIARPAMDGMLVEMMMKDCSGRISFRCARPARRRKAKFSLFARLPRAAFAGHPPNFPYSTPLFAGCTPKFPCFTPPAAILTPKYPLLRSIFNTRSDCVTTYVITRNWIT
jgi:hypothetical protein